MPIAIDEINAEIKVPTSDEVKVRAGHLSKPAMIKKADQPVNNDLNVFHGVYTALVTDNVDPAGMGRVKVSFPWAADNNGESHFDAWARIATLMAGHDRGTWFIPEIDDEVLVAFEAGDPRRPYVVGSLWNGVDKPPADISHQEDNDKKVIRSRNGIEITLIDDDGNEQLICSTPDGQTITLGDGPDRVKLEDSAGNRITLDNVGITIETQKKINVKASTINFNASLTNFSGMLQCDTLKSNTVVNGS